MRSCTPPPARRSWASARGWVLGAALVLAACGGGDCPPEVSPVPPVAGGGPLLARAAGLGGGLVVLQDAGGHEWVVDAEGVDVTLDGVAPGAAYDITVKVPPRERRCQVTGASGTLGPASAVVRVVCEPRPVVAAFLGLRAQQPADSLLRRFDVAAGNGQLEPGVDAPNAESIRILADPLGRFVFTAEPASRRVGVFEARSNDSASLLSSLALAGDRTPRMLAIDPAGRFLYVVSSPLPAVQPPGSEESRADELQAYRVGAGGELTPVGDRVPGINIAQPVVDPAGRFVYQLVQGETSGALLLRTLAVLPDGSLQPRLPDLAVGQGQTGAMALDPTGRVLVLAQDFPTRTVEVLLRGGQPGTWADVADDSLSLRDLPMPTDMVVRWVGARMVVLATSSLRNDLIWFSADGAGRMLGPPSRLPLSSLEGGGLLAADMASLALDDAGGLLYVTSDVSGEEPPATVLRLRLNASTGLPQSVDTAWQDPSLRSTNLVLVRR